MRLLPEKVSELDPNIRWEVETHLRIIEEVVLGSQVSVIDAPSREDAGERLSRAVSRRDGEAEDEAIVDYMRAEIRDWLQDFPDRRLLTDLYQRSARRTVATDSRDSRRRPSYEEGLRVAGGLLADIPDTGPLDAMGGHNRYESNGGQRAVLQQSFPPAPSCESTSSSHGPPASPSTLLALSARSCITGARPSPDCSPSGGRRLPVGSAGVPP